MESKKKRKRREKAKTAMTSSMVVGRNVSCSEEWKETELGKASCWQIVNISRVVRAKTEQKKIFIDRKCDDSEILRAAKRAEKNANADVSKRWISEIHVTRIPLKGIGIVARRVYLR